MKSTFLKESYTVLLGTFILMLVAFYNGYALVYSDSGTYLAAAFTLDIPIDRPIGYSLLIKCFGSISLWPVLLIQNLITAFIIYQVFKHFFSEHKNLRSYYLLSVLLLTITSGIAWYSNQIMPDFLTPVLILSLFLLFFKKNISKGMYGLIAIIFVYSVITHFSHLLIASIIALCIAGCNFIFFKNKWKLQSLRVKTNRALLTLGLALSGWLVLPTVNWLLSGEFYQSKSSHIFFIASMADKGILQQFLKDNCKKPTYNDCKLCAYKDQIPTTVADFIWDGSDTSVFNNTGGWNNSKAEYNRIIHASLINPKYLSQHIYKSLAYGLAQLPHNKIAEGLGRYREDSAPYFVISNRYKIEKNIYMNSVQNNIKDADLPKRVELLNDVQQILILLSLVYVCIVYFSPLKNQWLGSSLLFVSFMITGIIVNSLVTAGLSSPYSRYQARVTWLLFLALIILTLYNWNLIKDFVYQVFKRPGNVEKDQ